MITETLVCELCDRAYDPDSPPDPSVNQPPWDAVQDAFQSLGLSGNPSVCDECWVDVAIEAHAIHERDQSDPLEEVSP